ncbi:Crp/Fnr family transcriptional regulator [Flavobacterium sp.]|uniref:Crp/Fnr family transcriptional regulator n=1 Tax=Flavobacterium sp. TaxID=239 RepID=UPI0039E625EC
MIATEILLQFGAQLKTYKKGTVLFSEGQSARYYFQVESGEVKTNNFNDEGKEFIQGMFTQGDSFGESTLLNHRSYPASAETMTDATVYVLPKTAFFDMLHQHPETAIALCQRMADRLYYKAIIASEIASQDPEHRLLALIDFLKVEVGKCKADQKYEVTLTRQQLADLTGLRVETVIRTIKALEKKGCLTIDHHKIYR